MRAGYDRLQQLHPHLRPLLEAIEKNKKKFKTPPLGPLGMYTAVKPEYQALGPAVEQGIHPRNLLAFVVSCYPDEVLLRRLAEQITQPPTRGPPLRNILNVFV